ncbi:MAG: peptidylprolyl isomerase [Alphaproteobacteria bacterium]|nr:peptidylprolyl isomerase [Alphaproteobacteria bacterium]MCL2504673.1 peptidylprolyl isomerase [Alphaproteobacteria bacterium]
MTKNILALAVFALAVSVGTAYAQSSSFPKMDSKIAVVVNDSIISNVDIENRIRLMLLSAGLQDSLEVRSHLLPQVIRTLIEEQLQAQEAKRYNISVPKDEVEAVMNQIAKDNQIPMSMADFLRSQGISPSSMENQIRSTLLWNKLIQVAVRPSVEVGEGEIDAMIERMRQNAGKEEFLVSGIFLAVDNPKNEPQVLELAHNLAAKIKQGAPFSAIAMQFSQSSDAAQGGDIGWVQQGQLSSGIDKFLASASQGEISDPIRTADGFYIIGVRDKRTIVVGDPNKAALSLIQLFHPYDVDSKDAVLAEAAAVRAAFKSCAAINSDLKKFPNWRSQKLNNLPLATAPEWIADKVRHLNIGGASEILETDKGAVILFVCDKQDITGVDRENIMRSIGTEKLEMQARRFLSDLRKKAHIDMRIGNQL